MRIDEDPTPTEIARLGVWRLGLAAAPIPLLHRFAGTVAPQPCDVPDALRYVATARLTLKGPLVLEIEGPGDPLASAESVLRILALVHEHHPEVRTGLVIDGPLLAEYTEELTDFGLSYVVLRCDAISQRSAQRFVRGALFKGETMEREEAARLYLDENLRALDHARRAEIAVAVRTTLVPAWNEYEIEDIARQAAQMGAQRIDVIAPAPETVPAAMAPTAAEVTDANRMAQQVFFEERVGNPRLDMMQWLAPDRFEPVNIDTLEAVDVLRTLPDPEAEAPQLGRVLPPRRAQLVAVATRDGERVDLPLSGATSLSVYAVTSQHIRLLGMRPIEESPRRRHDGVGNAQAFLRALVGCRTLVATDFSSRAVTLLGAVGIRPVAIQGPVSDVLDRVARGTLSVSQ